MKTISKTILATALIVMTSVTFAQTIEVGGDYKTDVNVKNVTSLALGEHARSDVNLAGIQVDGADVKIGGDYTSTVKADNVTALALGKNVSARINLGGIQQGVMP
jgi:hypothetical protein